MTDIDNLAEAHPDILIVTGSPRPRGNSDTLAAAMARAAREQGVSCAVIHLRTLRFSSCIGCEKCRKAKACVGLHDGLTPLYPVLESARGLALVSPTHQYNMSAWMKAFIDRLYCYYDFTDTRPRGWASRLAGQDRKAVVAAVCEQPEKKDMGFTLDAMRLPIEALGFEMVGEQAVLRIFDKGAVADDAPAMEQAGQLGAALARAVRG